jgi:hypothetical protein
MQNKIVAGGETDMCHGWEEIQFLWRNLWQDLYTDGKVLLKLILKEIKLESMEWIHLAEDRHMWQALVNSVKNLQVPPNVRKFLTN